MTVFLDKKQERRDIFANLATKLKVEYGIHYSQQAKEINRSPTWFRSVMNDGTSVVKQTDIDNLLVAYAHKLEERPTTEEYLSIEDKYYHTLEKLEAVREERERLLKEREELWARIKKLEAEKLKNLE